MTSLRHSIGSSERVTGERVIENPFFQPLLNRTLMAATARNEEKGGKFSNKSNSRISWRGGRQRRGKRKLTNWDSSVKKGKGRRRLRYILVTRFPWKINNFESPWRWESSLGGSQIPALPDHETRRCRLSSKIWKFFTSVALISQLFHSEKVSREKQENWAN